MLCKSGLNPPCIVNIFSSMIAAIGRQLKQSVNVFHNLILYRRLPADINSIPRAADSLTFVVKPIDAVNAGAFMITAEDKEVFWIFDFVGKE